MTTNTDDGYLLSQMNVGGVELHNINTDPTPSGYQPQTTRQNSQGHTVLAPNTTLPNELIREIISHHAHGEPLTFGNSDIRVQITQVCSSWRNAAFGTPELWTLELEKAPQEHTINLIAAWLRQCTSSRISLTISHSALIQLSYGPLLLKEGIIPNARRFKTLTCPSVLPGQWRSLPFDVARALFIRFSPFPTYNSDLLQAPLLQTFGVIGIAKYHNSEYRGLLRCLPEIPWGQLTSLSLTGSLYINDVHNVLSLCTSLEKCNLDTIYENPNRQTRSKVPTMNLPQLKNLRICFESSSDFEQEFFLFGFPNIVSLGVTIPLDARPLCKLAGVLRKSQALRRFTMIHESFLYPFLTAILLDELPFATHIAAGTARLSLETLKTIGTGDLLPDIEEIEFTAERENTVDEILDTLLPESATPSLTQITIFVAAPEALCSETRIESLRLQGITVRQTVKQPRRHW